MAEKFKGKYRIPSARLAGYDYASEGLYFVTICTEDREHYFGEIENGEIILSDVGKIVQNEWLQTEIARRSVFLDEWVIMPNHLHGILEIYDGDINTADKSTAIIPPSTVVSPFAVVPTPASVSPFASVETPRRGVSTTNAANITNVNNSLRSHYSQRKIIKQYPRIYNVQSKKLGTRS